MCVATCTSNRRDDIFLPFPPEYLKDNQRDYKSLENILNLIPSVKGATRRDLNYKINSHSFFL